MLHVNFNVTDCQNTSNNRRFGLCDDPPPAKNPAYIDEIDGSKWIAIVCNDHHFSVLFTAIDNCIEIKRADGLMDKRCDGMLSYISDVLGRTVVFVELKTGAVIRGSWVKDAEAQLRVTISRFEDTKESDNFKTKKAYIANSTYPRYRESQMGRMDKFCDDTGYVLRIENRLVLD